MKLLHKPLAPMSINYTAPNTWEHIGSTGQKTRVLISTGTYFVAAQDTYFNLAGLSQQEKTIFFQSLSSQQYSINFFRGAAVGDSYVELLLYSAVPINDTDLITVFSGGPGGQFTNTNWEQIPYWRTANAYIGLDQGGYQQLIHQAVNVGGSGAATASDRIYVYRLASGTFATPGAGVTESYTAPTTCIMLIDEREEPDYQYIMRLKKSYDLQQSFDVDGNRPH